MSLELLERQLARKPKKATPEEEKSQLIAALRGDDLANAAPSSSASIVFDAVVAKKIAVARRALDRRANVRDHMAKYAEETLPIEYIKEAEKTTRIAQKLYRKGTSKLSQKHRRSEGRKLRVPLAEKNAEAESRRTKLRKSRKGTTSTSSTKKSKRQQKGRGK
jgi:hypothetical protein